MGIVNVIMLNILFGIIVDTFGQLRATKAESDKDISNICYICGLDRQTLDRKGNGFAIHIETDHQKWNYIKYIVRLSLFCLHMFLSWRFDNILWNHRLNC